MDGRRRSTAANPYELTEETPVYVISVAAQLSGLHPQTLRQYDRLGLVSPDRTAGRGRRYSARDIELLRTVQQLSQDEGINLAGIKRIIELENQVAALQSRVAELQAARRRRGGGDAASARRRCTRRTAATWCRTRTCSRPARWWCGGRRRPRTRQQQRRRGPERDLRAPSRVRPGLRSRSPRCRTPIGVVAASAPAASRRTTR